MLIAISHYAILFTSPFLRFNVADTKRGTAVVRSLNVPEALYYSGVSFTTVGYGDITPDGLARFLAISEAIVGVTLAGGFIVALTRKYVD